MLEASVVVSQHLLGMMTMNNSTKTCNSCNGVYPATNEYFYARKCGKNGLNARCKACVIAKQREYQSTHTKGKTAYNRSYYSKNKEQLDERNRQYHAENYESIAENAKLYHSRNKEKRNAQSRQRYIDNRELYAENAREYRLLNKERIAENARKYAKENPERYCISSSNRRARIRNLPDTFTLEQWLGCLEYFNYCCAVCGSQLRDLFGDTIPHADHWIPLASEECTGTILTNMVCLCNHCNLSKHDTTPKEWLLKHYSKKQAQVILKRIENYFNID